MSTLVSRNITVDGRRTSIRLEPTMWDALQEICDREGMSIHQFCTAVDHQRHESSLTASIRVAILMYYRQQLAQQADEMEEGQADAAAAAETATPSGDQLTDPVAAYSAALLPV